MRKGIHPKYKKLRIKIGDDFFETMSTLQKDEILMDIDFRKHPAWTKKGVAVINTNKNVATFKERFSGLSLINRK